MWINVNKPYDYEHRSPAGALMAMTALKVSSEHQMVTEAVGKAAIAAGAAEEVGRPNKAVDSPVSLVGQVSEAQ